MSGPQFTRVDGVVLPVKVPMIDRVSLSYGHEDPTVIDPEWDPGRRTAPIVTPCETCDGDVLLPGKFGVDPLGLKRCSNCTRGYVDTGERCTWTLAPVMPDQPPGQGPDIYMTPDGFIISPAATKPKGLKSGPWGKFSEGDWVAIPKVTP